ncbi:alpha/beta hydrolase [Blastochloris viridis]|uniref:Thioesterase domain-containing protein n=1 Tax=Blastochloris viridis TaxID=1079 RepID=A0A0H5BC11_BLAVI|nr:alpha/beta hydrolase [Blastochloris viridis]ALK10270.1 hypothetical protein BVIR_2504 [Blastochloris viridis]BAR99797.1 hypothetical protein BV133_2204 [Blastochloris viridis]CUU42932.1 hypothetical protein BVIRIDIS_19480 [Blastochloris viridis]
MLGFLRFLIAITAIASLSVTTADAAQPRPTTETRVYLLRGLANVFSLGLDDLAEKLARRGVQATVANHADADLIADEIINRRAAGWRGPVVLIGHSLGADAVYPLAARLAAAKIKVPLVVSFDPVHHEVVPANVSKAINYYLSGCCYAVQPGAGFRGSLSNFDMEGKGGLGHLNIEKSPELHAEVISRVMTLAQPRQRPRPARAAPVDGAPEPAKPAAEITGSAAAAAPGLEAPAH